MTTAAAAASARLSTDIFTTHRVRRRKHDPCFVIEPAEAAESAGLRYVTDTESGFRSHAGGKRRRFVDHTGVRVTDPKHLARIEALVIPPAWTDVWVCARSDGHLQATGRDARGRKQYRYHPRWRAVRDENKYGRLREFGEALPIIRERVEMDLRRPGIPREKVIAAVVRLLETTLIRVGNEEYARSNASYGLTTLRDEHVDIKGGAVRFTFRGKSGKDHEIDLRDRRMANIVRKCRDLPGQVLFQYEESEGSLHPVGSADVNAYLRQATGQDFTAKDFRTWFGTVIAASELLGSEPSGTEREQKAKVVEAIRNVAARLGNTPAVCRRCYVHPRLIEAYEDGALVKIAQRLEDRDDEALVLKLLGT